MGGIMTQTITLDIEGMTCASCVAHVERALSKVDGVNSVSVNLTTGKAQLTSVRDIPLDKLIRQVKDAGYSAQPVQNDEDRNQKQELERESLNRHFIISAVLCLPLVILEMGAHMLPTFHHWLMANLGSGNWIIQALLTTLIMFGPGRVFYQKGLPALVRLAPDMNSLVALGSLAAWGYSLVATFLPEFLPTGTVHVYYEAAAVIVTLILLGRLLEQRARGRTSEAISRLIKLQPTKATRISDGKTEEVEIKQIQLADTLLAHPGERIALDGEVIEGSSYVDESMVTGEAVPVSKSPGTQLIGGTLNTNGSLIYRVTHIGDDTFLSRIIQLVENAQSTKLPVQALVDKITLWFVPAIIVIALATFLVWFFFGPQPALGLALVNAVAVLIIACPCALGLATPTSIMVATGRAASLGILFRRGNALQDLRNIKTIAFDKTGTLTEGKPQLTDFIVANGFEKNWLLSLAAAAEQHSEHPIANALVKAAENNNIKLGKLESFNTIPGSGLEAKVSNEKIIIGADRLFHFLGISLESLADKAQELAAQGKTPVYMSVNNRAAAVMALSDTLKPGTAAAMQSLHQMGFTLAMITGDNRKTADVIAKTLGIDHVVAEVMPEQKVEAVKQLRQQYGTLAYVGDGINDAPALAEADLGMAVGTGTDIAIESADIILVNGDLQGIPSSIALARATMRNIKQNLFWAFAYNVALIPLAAGIAYPFSGWLLSPMLAAAAMALSSIFVVTNALSLRQWKLRR
jgi:heavy metal translocating P-type ATPase